MQASERGVQRSLLTERRVAEPLPPPWPQGWSGCCGGNLPRWVWWGSSELLSCHEGTWRTHSAVPALTHLLTTNAQRTPMSNTRDCNSLRKKSAPHLLTEQQIAPSQVSRQWPCPSRGHHSSERPSLSRPPAPHPGHRRQRHLLRPPRGLRRVGVHGGGPPTAPWEGGGPESLPGLALHFPSAWCVHEKEQAGRSPE